MPWGMRGSFGTTGGLTRTYGLQRHFSEAPGDQKLKIERAKVTRIVPYFRPYWKQWVVVLMCIGVTAGLGVLPPRCVGLIIDNTLPPHHHNPLLLALLAVAIVGLAVMSGLVGVLQQSLTARAGQSILYDLREELYRNLQRMSLHFYTANRSGEIVSRVNNDVNAVQTTVTGAFVGIASNIATLIAASAMLLSMNWRLTLLAVLVVPAFYLPSRIVGKVRWRLSMQTQEKRAGMLAFLNERLQVGGLVLANIFGQHQADAREFAQSSASVRDLNVRQSVVGRWLMMTLTVFSALGPALVYWYGGLEVMAGKMQVGQLVAFAALLGLLYRPLIQLASVYADAQAALAVFERIFEYLDLQPDVQDPHAPHPLPHTRGHVVFDDVCFTHPLPPALRGADDVQASKGEVAKERFSLQHVSFQIAPGQRVALVGPSGAGKSTLTYLLPRFYDPDCGCIRLDGHDLRDLSQAELRQHIGMVTQETFLFHDTVRANLLYADPHASEANLIEACRAANIHEFIASLPDGYDTLVGERGFRLSGGEKQRLSIARAILKDPAILVLDEATSNLDATSEYLIQQALEKLLRGRTSLIIAHRLSTIVHADLIVVLDHGRIVESGRHDQLLAAGGLYASLFEKQFGKVLALTDRSEHHEPG